MGALWSDLKLAVRVLRQAPGFSLAAVLALALGIGPNTAIYSVVYATLLAPLPFPEPDELVMVWSTPPGGTRNTVSAATYRDWKEQSTAFRHLAAFTSREVNLAIDGGTPERVRARLTSAEGHRLLGEGVWLGRDFRPDEDQPGKNHVVLLSHRLWRQRYGGDRDIIGRQIRIDSTPHTVVGVLPPGASDRLPAALWLPLAFTPDQVNHDFHWLLVMGRLNDDVTIEQAQQQLGAITADIAQRFPSNKGWGVSVEPLQNNFLSQNTRATLWLLLAAVGFVVLIACVNVANLLLARATARKRETAIRASLGASRTRLFRQVLTESAVLAATGGALGVLLGSWILQAILAISPPGTLPAEADPGLNVPVLVFTLVTTAMSGLLFGAAPAWHVGRVDMNEALKQSGRAVVTGGRLGLRQALVVVEFALALTLLAGAGLTIYSFWNRTQVDLGVEREQILTFSLPLGEQQSETPARINSFYRQLLDELAAVPGVTRAAISTGLPIRGNNIGMPFTVASRPEAAEGGRPGAPFNMIAPGYFDLFEIGLLRGRTFTDQDVAGAVRVAVVNQRFTEVYLEGLDPLRQQLGIEELIPGVRRLGPLVEWQIVGVVADANNGVALGDRAAPEIYVPFWQSPWPQANVAVRTATDPTAMRESLAEAVRSLDPALPLANLTTMDRIVSERMAPDRLNIALYSALAGIALLLAALGIYGVMTFVVAQRTSEIGLRMALGAARGQVLLRFLREGLVLAVIGLMVGLVGAYTLGRAMQSTLYGTGALSLPVLLAVGAVLLGAALAACYVPAHRASAVDPMVALRQE